ncbi:hypothetical protein [Micromonospora tarensis]|uniref:SPFH domain / Band 7 family protein n=1 Tax=Micromonospora tarensis TaxID=2806100 RepID=A0ABS1Y9P9_9ACTN|nr:hypothetical protein [Micromonospora tarensis]MBM0274131.1 hypothetical protein [Micromonospora tarensis]
MRAVSSTSVLLPVGGVWQLLVDADTAPSVVVTPPTGDPVPVTPEQTSAGRWETSYEVTEPGRHVARASLDGAVVDFAGQALEVTAGPVLDVPKVVAYLGQISATQDTVGDALAAETFAQAAVCRVGAIYPPDLREALLRRVARNLALRGVPLAVLRGDAETGSTVLPGRDPEVRRLEAPHRRLPIG